uniref:Uncharacterized protein n=1 Tax=Melopsittacus undulatus TaxID=13146 RepID=A0A8V5FYY5_MELUD
MYIYPSFSLLANVPSGLCFHVTQLQTGTTRNGAGWGVPGPPLAARAGLLLPAARLLPGHRLYGCGGVPPREPPLPPFSLPPRGPCPAAAPGGERGEVLRSARPPPAPLPAPCQPVLSSVPVPGRAAARGAREGAMSHGARVIRTGVSSAGPAAPPGSTAASSSAGSDAELMDGAYFRSCAGILKVAQMLRMNKERADSPDKKEENQNYLLKAEEEKYTNNFKISLVVGFISVNNSPWTDYSVYSYFQIVTMCDLVMILFFYVIHIFRIYRKLTCVSWPLAEFLHYLIGTILLLIASIVAASKSYNLTGLVAGATFGFIATILCVLSIWSSYKVSCITQSTSASV